jgi:hypothetical protein
VRSWLFGAKLAERRTLKPDAELVAVSVLLHDLGLARGGAPDRRFEVVGADAGRAFALSHNSGGTPRRDCMGLDRPSHYRVDRTS